MSRLHYMKPRMSEKAYSASQSSGVYVFVVPKSANKLEVKQSVSAQFNVTVQSVNVSRLPSKAKRSVRKGGRKVSKGTQQGIKKAYVTLEKGQTIPIFAAEDEAKAKAEKTEKLLAKRSKK